MPLLLLMLMPALLTGPILTQKVFRETLSLEHNIIWLDNAAILMGRGDRNVMNQLRAGNEKMKNLESQHHVWHGCAKIPSPKQPLCAEADRFYEAALRAFHQSLFNWAQREWTANEERVRRDVGRHELEITVMERATPLPLVEHRCSLCDQRVYWEISTEKLPLCSYVKGKFRSRFPPPNIRVRLEGRSLLRGSDWDYALQPETGLK